MADEQGKVGADDQTPGDGSSANPRTVRSRPVAADLPHHEFVDLAQWLSAKSVLLRMALVTQGLELSLSAAGHEDQRRMAIDVSQGQLVVETPLADLERVISLIIQERARAQGVTIKNVTLRLQGVRPRELDLFVTVSAKQGFLSATVEVRARVTINETFHARVSGVEVHGQGMLGSVVAVWLRPQMKQIEQEEYHISSLLPGNLRINDVRLEVDQRIRIIASLAGSSVHVEKPQDTNLPALPRAESPKSAASPRSALAAPRKLDIYIVDTGWNERAKAVLESHLTLFEAFLTGQNVYFLSMQQSQDLLQKNPALVGADPILMVVDSERRAQPSDQGYGFRLCLGSMTQDATCVATLERMLRIVAEGSPENTDAMVERITAEMRPEGPDGAMQLIVDVIESVKKR